MISMTTGVKVVSVAGVVALTAACANTARLPNPDNYYQTTVSLGADANSIADPIERQCIGPNQIVFERAALERSTFTEIPPAEPGGEVTYSEQKPLPYCSESSNPDTRDGVRLDTRAPLSVSIVPHPAEIGCDNRDSIIGGGIRRLTGLDTVQFARDIATSASGGRLNEAAFCTQMRLQYQMAAAQYPDILPTYQWPQAVQEQPNRLNLPSVSGRVGDAYAAVVSEEERKEQCPNLDWTPGTFVNILTKGSACPGARRN